jgi:7-cyano-7-deazaguanine synthase
VKTGLLLSGGIDSIAIAFWKRPDIALTIDYGHLPALGEIQAAAAVCASLGIPHKILRIDCSALGSGDLAGRAHLRQAPVTEWWPYRNQLLVTIGAAYLLSFDISALLLGCVRTDASHADGRPEFIDLLSRLLGLQEGKMGLSAPAQTATQVGRGITLGASGADRVTHDHADVCAGLVGSFEAALAFDSAKHG